MTENEDEYPELHTTNQIMDDCMNCSLYNITNKTFTGDYIFNRLDTRVFLVLAYSFVFCCCFFGKNKFTLKFHLQYFLLCFERLIANLLTA